MNNYIYFYHSYEIKRRMRVDENILNYAEKKRVEALMSYRHVKRADRNTWIIKVILDWTPTGRRKEVDPDVPGETKSRQDNGRTRP